MICVFVSAFCCTQIVPCKARLAVNASVRELVLFSALGSMYNIHVAKGVNKTWLHGQQWEQFICKHNITEGDMLVFTFKPHPSIYHVNVDRGNDEEDTDKISESNDEDADSSDDIFNDEDRIRVAQRVCLNRQEKNRLVEILPVQDYVGVLFVIRFTSTNLNRHDMVTRPPLSCMPP